MGIRSEIQYLIHGILWLTAISIPLLLINNYGAFTSGDGSVFFGVIVGTLFSVLLFYFNSHFLMPRYFSKGKHLLYWLFFISWLLGQTLIEAIIDFYFLINFYSSYSEPFISFLLYNLSVNTIVGLISFTYRFIKDWGHNEREKRKLMEEKLQSEIAFLKSRINPHFLFNILNSLYASSLHYEVPVLTQRLEEVSDIMRYMVYDTEQEDVSIMDEIRFVEKFVEVSKMRLPVALREKVSLQFKGPEDSVSIVPLLFLPLLENVFKHAATTKPNFFIRIELDYDLNTVQFSTTNLIDPKKPKIDEKSGFGLETLKKRLDYSYPNRHQLKVETKGNEYFTSLKIWPNA